MIKNKSTSKSASYAVAVDDDGCLAVSVQPTAGGRWRVEQWHRGAEMTLPAGLVRQMKQAGCVAWLLPEDDVTCAMTPLPRLRRRELNRAVAGWVARKEGGQPADWVSSWRQLEEGRTSDNRQQVYLAYAPQTVIARENAKAEKVGVNPGLMLPASLVLDQLFRRAGPDHDTLKVWNLVFIGEHTSLLCVANRQCLLLSRTLPRDLAAEVTDAEYTERLVTEVDRSAFFARQTEGVSSVDKVVVCGDPVLAQGLVAQLGETSERSAIHWPLTDVVDLNGHEPSIDEQLLLAAAILAGEGADYSLASARDHGLLNARSRRRLLLAAAAAAVSLVPLLTVGALITSRIQHQYLDDARARIATATEQAQSAAEVYERQRLLRAREEHLDRFMTRRHDLAATLLNLAAVTPPQVRYRDLQVIDRTDRVLLHLTAESTAATVTEAQQAFMVFYAALDASIFLRPLGEPRQLQITEQNEAERANKAVLFSLDYELVAEATTGEGS